MQGIQQLGYSLVAAMAIVTVSAAQPEGVDAGDVPVYHSIVQAQVGEMHRYSIVQSSVVDYKGVRREDPKTVGKVEIRVLQIEDDGPLVRWQYLEDVDGDGEQASGPPFDIWFDTAWQPVGVENPETIRAFNRGVFLRTGESKMAAEPKYGQAELDEQMRVWEEGMDDPAEVLALAAARPARFFFGLGWSLAVGEERVWESLDSGPFGFAITVQNRVHAEPDERGDGVSLVWTMTQDAEELGRQTIEMMRAADEISGRSGVAYPKPEEFTLSETTLEYRVDPESGWMSEVRIVHQTKVGTRHESRTQVYQAIE
ncbi:MAG: hypothetical protein ACI89L_000477 [Phycisphaerales bacterium]|jgi:hypothetical protein